LANIKADLRIRIGEFDKKVEVESTAMCPTVESDSHAEELKQELARTIILQEFPGSDMVSEDDGQASQLTVNRVLLSNEAALAWALGNDLLVEELGPKLQSAQEG